MSKNRLQTPSNNKASRLHLQPPYLPNPTADSRLLQPSSPTRPDPIPDQLLRQLNKIRRDITQSRQRLDPNPLNKSVESFSTKHRLQFIQQKFKQKDELLLFQQTVIENLKSDLKHRDEVISAIRDRQEGRSGIVVRNVRESNRDRMESPIFNKSHMLSFIEDNIAENTPVKNVQQALEGEYNIRVFSSEELLSNLINEQHEHQQTEQQQSNQQTNQKLDKITKQYESAKVTFKANQIKLRKEINQMVEESMKVRKECEELVRREKQAKEQMEKIKIQFEGVKRLLEVEKKQHQEALQKAREFDSVERNLRMALLTKENLIKQLTTQLNTVRVTSKAFSSGKSVSDQELKCQLEGTRIQLISKELELRDMQKICRKLQNELSTARKDLQNFFVSKSRSSSLSSSTSPIKIEQPNNPKPILPCSPSHPKPTQDKSTSTPTIPTSTLPKPSQKRKPTKPRNRHICCSPQPTTIARSRSFTYYPVIKWNKVVH